MLRVSLVFHTIDPNISLKKKELKATLSSVNVANNQITITGSGFSNISVVKLQGNGIDADLSVYSKSNTQIIAKATSALSLLVNGTFNLIIGTVEAQAISMEKMKIKVLQG